MINTILLDMPGTIKAYTVADKNGDYTIVLNSRLNHEQHLASYAHEMHHIKNGDFDRKCSADLIEFFAHGGTL